MASGTRSPRRPVVLDAGVPGRLGAAFTGDGVSFALYSEAATAVELCLFDSDDRQTAALRLPGHKDHWWYGFVPQCGPGQRYAYRVHGSYAPERGHFCNPAKLLLDPYARQLSGAVRPTRLHYPIASDGQPLSPDEVMLDSAPATPKCVVTGAQPLPDRASLCAWTDTVIYETHLRGYTMRHPDVPEHERGTFAGLSRGEVLDYVRSLGVTAIELLPVFASASERFLIERGLTNYWGYNTIAFFAPEPRYLAGTEIGEVRAAVEAAHDRGLEVILDVVYNHTAEGGADGPTLSFRGLDNGTYYRMHPEHAGHFINDTGCGNTLNVDHPIVQRLILDSLRYWADEIGVDGFRFDLAPVLGRGWDGYSADHPLLQAITEELKHVRLIAEPWDVGPGGYQLGGFPAPFAEWNDRYRDSVRRFWRGDMGEAAEFASRFHGSADIFEPSGRAPTASVNFVSSHDGYTLRDVVSYEKRHNLANGENNRDGHSANFSCNYGVEGATDNEALQRLRDRQRRNMLATVLLSHGTPMLLAGDEMGHTQHGNNNAYAQDNELTWLDWSALQTERSLAADVASLTRLRARLSVLGDGVYRHGEPVVGDQPNIQWLAAAGTPLRDADWRSIRALTIVARAQDATGAPNAVAVAFNAGVDPLMCRLPAGRWRCEYATADALPEHSDQGWPLAARSLAVFVPEGEKSGVSAPS